MATLNELNALRTAANMKPLRVWKASKAALADAIAKLQRNTTTEQHLKASADVAKPADKVKAKFGVAAIAKKLGINDKVARAKLRRHFGKDYMAQSVETITAVLTTDSRKKA